jgi:hypothetical protein
VGLLPAGINGSSKTRVLKISDSVGAAEKRSFADESFGVVAARAGYGNVKTTRRTKINPRWTVKIPPADLVIFIQRKRPKSILSQLPKPNELRKTVIAPANQSRLGHGQAETKIDQSV